MDDNRTPNDNLADVDNGELLRQLYQALMRTRFGFVPAGTHELKDVYVKVKSRFPGLCNDRYLCREHCTRGYNSPEWRHTVRTALNILKQESRGDIRRRRAGERGFWRFRMPPE
jgi:hypothetical protein